MLIPCRLSRAGLRCLRCHGICAGAPFCATTAIGDERHCVFDCPHFQGLRQQHAGIFRDSHDAMRSVMWHKDQKFVYSLLQFVLACTADVHKAALSGEPMPLEYCWQRWYIIRGLYCTRLVGSYTCLIHCYSQGPGQACQSRRGQACNPL